MPSQPTPHQQRVDHEDHQQGRGPPQHRQQEERHSASYPFRRFEEPLPSFFGVAMIPEGGAFQPSAINDVGSKKGEA